jgi:hypothetical protein
MLRASSSSRLTVLLRHSVRRAGRKAQTVDVPLLQALRLAEATNPWVVMAALVALVTVDCRQRVDCRYRENFWVAVIRYCVGKGVHTARNPF